MPVPNGIAAATLTGNGYTLTNGVYTQTFGSIVVNITLSTEVEGSGFAGVLQVLPGGDLSASDAASVAANLVKIGFSNFTNWPNIDVQFGAQRGQVSYGQSF